MIGVDIEQAREEVRKAASRSEREARGAAEPAVAEQERPAMPDPREPRFAIERETLKLVLQHPSAVGRTAADVGTNDFTHPTFRSCGSWSRRTAGLRRPTPGGPAASAPMRPTPSCSRRSAPWPWSR